MAADAEVFALVEEQINSLKSDADTAVNELITVSQNQYYPAATTTGFDNNPTWSLDDVPLTGLKVAALGDLDKDDWAIQTARETTLGTAPTLTRDAWDNEKARTISLGAAPTLDKAAWNIAAPREVAVGAQPVLDKVEWGIDKAREVTLTQPAGPNVEVPAYTYNPQDILPDTLLETYKYQSAFFDSFLEPRLMEYIDSQSYFLAQEVQDALFEASRERDLQILNDAVDTVSREQARKGFPVPHSIMMAARNDVIKKYQDTYADRNKEITALIADKSLQEKMHAMDTSIKMEEIRSQITLAFAQMYWQASDYLLKKYEADLRAEIAKIENQLALIRIQADIDMKMSDQDLRHVEQNSDMKKSLLSAGVEGYKTEARFVELGAEVDMKMAENDLRLAELDSQMRQQLLSATIEQFKVDARFVELLAEFDAKMAENELRSTEINSDMRKTLLMVEIEQFKVDARFKELISELDIKMGDHDLQHEELVSKMQIAILQAKIAEYQEGVKAKLTDADLEAKVAEFGFKDIELEQQKQLARLNVSVEEMRGNVETWKHNLTARIQAAQQAIEYYKFVVSSASGMINDITVKDVTTA